MQEISSGNGPLPLRDRTSRTRSPAFLGRGCRSPGRTPPRPWGEGAGSRGG